MKKIVDGVLSEMSEDEIAEITSIQDASRSAIERERRDMKLATEVDPIAGNALRWVALDSETQALWATYRQALLDVPQQDGFPNDIAWPTKP